MTLHECQFLNLDECERATGTVVVIDVCRAFTSAAFAFGSGAERILLAGTVEEALALRERFPGSLTMGEVRGLPVEDFDLWNSPTELSYADLRGVTLIQRTSAGTQGIVRSTQAERLFAASFAVAGATVQAVRQAGSGPVTFVVTGTHPEDPRYGLEDRACAEYMAALLRSGAGEEGEGAGVAPAPVPDPRDYLNWLHKFLALHDNPDWPEEERDTFLDDVELCCWVDRFHYAMPVRREGDLLIMEKTPFASNNAPEE